MDRQKQCFSNVRYLGPKFYRRPVAQQQARTWVVRALWAWAWPGSLSWNAGTSTPGPYPSVSRPPPPPPASSITAPRPAQPAQASQQETSRPREGGGLPDLTADKRARTSSGNGSGNGSSETNTSGQAGGENPTSGVELRHRLPPQRLQLQAPGADTFVTFAYGANMNFLTLARRGVRVLSRDPAFVLDPDVQLVFKHQGGYATLERAGNGGEATSGKDEPRFRPYDGRIHGVLYRVTRQDFEKLAKREGGYLVQELQVQTYDGLQYSALVFVSNPLFKLPQEVIPTEKYLARLREGARDNYLDPGYQAFLSGINTVPGAGLGSEYFNTPSKYMGYSFLIVVALITLAFFFQH